MYFRHEGLGLLCAYNTYFVFTIATCRILFQAATC